MADAKRRDRRGFIVPTLILLVICLGAISALSGNLLRGVSVDLTQDKVFTLTWSRRRPPTAPMSSASGRSSTAIASCRTARSGWKSTNPSASPTRRTGRPASA